MDKNLDNLRKEINKIDDELINLFVKRMKISQDIGQFKKENNLPILDEKREALIYTKLEDIAKDKNISSDLLKDIWKLLITESKNKQV